MINFIFVLMTAAPIAILISQFFVEPVEWYVSFSIGMVSMMIADVFVKHVGE